MSERLAEALHRPPVGLLLLELAIENETSDQQVEQDLVDRAVDQRLAPETEPDDVLLRIGPTSLAIIRAGLRAPSEAEGLALRIHAALQAPVSAGETKLTCRTSIGVAVSHRTDTAQQLQRYAQHALDDAKLIGPDLVAVFDDQDRDLLHP